MSWSIHSFIYAFIHSADKRRVPLGLGTERGAGPALPPELSMQGCSLGRHLAGHTPDRLPHKGK